MEPGTPEGMCCWRADTSGSWMSRLAHCVFCSPFQPLLLPFLLLTVHPAQILTASWKLPGCLDTKLAHCVPCAYKDLSFLLYLENMDAFFNTVPLTHLSPHSERNHFSLCISNSEYVTLPHCSILLAFCVDFPSTMKAPSARKTQNRLLFLSRS